MTSSNLKQPTARELRAYVLRGASDVLQPADHVQRQLDLKSARNSTDNAMYRAWRSRGFSPVSSMLSEGAHELLVLMERYEQNDPTLSEHQRERVEIALGIIDESTVIKHDIAGFLAAFKTKEEFMPAFYDYSNPAWLGKVTKATAVALCSALVKLCHQFGIEPNSLWLKYAA